MAGALLLLVTPLSHWAWFLAYVGASVVRGLTGFGLAIVMVPLIGIIIAPQQAVLVGILSSLMMAPLGYATSRKRVDPAVMRPLLIATDDSPMWCRDQIVENHTGAMLWCMELELRLLQIDDWFRDAGGIEDRKSVV